MKEYIVAVVDPVDIPDVAADLRHAKFKVVGMVGLLSLITVLAEEDQLDIIRSIPKVVYVSENTIAKSLVGLSADLQSTMIAMNK